MAVFVVRKKAGDRFVDKSSRVQKWQMFSETDTRGITASGTGKIDALENRFGDNPSG